MHGCLILCPVSSSEHPIFLSPGRQDSIVQPTHPVVFIHPPGKETKWSETTRDAIAWGNSKYSSQLWRSTFGFCSDQLCNWTMMASISRAQWIRSYLLSPPLPDGWIALQDCRMTCIFKSIQERQEVIFNSKLLYQNSIIVNLCTSPVCSLVWVLWFRLKPPSLYELCTITRDLCKIQNTVCSLCLFCTAFITETSVRSALAKGLSEFPL